MNNFFANSPQQGLTRFDNVSRDGYLVAKNYILIELYRDPYILDFYIIPSKDKRCIILCHLPELEMIDKVKDDKPRMLKLMSYSKLFTKILKNSLTSSNENDFRFVKIRDFTDQTSDKLKWCILCPTQIPYNKIIFDESTKENKFIEQILGDICYVVNDFDEVNNKYNLDPQNKSWIANSRVRKLAKIAYEVHNEGWCTFGCSLRDNILNDKVKELILKEGYILLTDTGIGYPFDIPVPKSDINDSILIVRADLFFPNLKKEDFVYFIHLKPKGDNLWEASININKNIVEAIDTCLNFIDTKNGKIPAFAYQYLPYSAHIWINSNPNTRNKPFEKCVECIIESDKKILERPFSDEKYKAIVKSGHSLKLKNKVNIFLSDKPWKNLEPLSELLFYGMVVSKEAHNIANNSERIKAEAKQRHREQWVELFVNGIKIYARAKRFL